MSSKKILLIDDEKWFAMPFIERLKYDGNEVDFEKNISRGIQAYNTAEENGEPYNVIIIDLMLPFGEEVEPEKSSEFQEPGLYLLKYLREKDQNIPIFCYTVLDDSKTIAKINSLNAKHYAKASGRDEELFSEIEEILQF